MRNRQKEDGQSNELLECEERRWGLETDLLESSSIVNELDDDLLASFSSDAFAELSKGVRDRLLTVGRLPVVGEPEVTRQSGQRGSSLPARKKKRRKEKRERTAEPQTSRS